MAESGGAPLRAEAEVVSNRCEGGANHRLVLRVPDWPGAGPGQFVMLSPGALGAVPRSDPLLPRPMAVYRAQRGADGAWQVEVLYKRTGRGTALLSEALPGQRVGLVGPLGRAFEPPAADERPVLVAGGTGVASVYELARSLAPRDVVVLLGARGIADLMGLSDFAALGVDLRIATEDGSRGEKGLVTQLLDALLAGGGRHRVYCCGPTPMMRRCAELAAASGTPCVASLENHMACGFGVCLGCAAPLAAGGYALVCRDGPVLDASKVAWGALP